MVKKRPTIKDIAAAVGVSNTVVSQVLRGVEGSLVSATTRQRILDTARELGYRPNRYAQALVSGRTRTVAIWKHSLNTSFHAWVVSDFARHAQDAGYEVVIRDFESITMDTVRVYMDDVDGVLAHECPVHVRMFLDQQSSASLPIVSTGVFYITDCDYVGVDLLPAAREAVQHLRSLGCRRIAFVSPSGDSPSGEPRYTAYASAMREWELPEEWIQVPRGPRSVLRGFLRDYWARYGVPEGIFCHNDETAIICLRALHDCGVRVPQDAAVVGCDGLEETEYTIPELSTIVQPIEEMSRLAWDLLTQRLNKPEAETAGYVLPARFVVRESAQRS